MKKNKSNIKDISVISDNKTGGFIGAWMTIDGVKKFLDDDYEIRRYLGIFMKDNDLDSLKGLDRKFFRNKFLYNKDKAVEGVFEKQIDLDEYIKQENEQYFKSESKSSILNLVRKSPHEGKKTIGIKGKVAIAVAGVLTIGSIIACAKDKVNGIVKPTLSESVSKASDEDMELDLQLTDNDILNKDFDYYSDNYDYNIQMQVAYTADTFLDEANSKFAKLGLELPDGTKVNGLFTAEEAWVYAITINNLGIDEIVDVYQDSKFDYANFEDVKQDMIRKMMQYQYLVSFGKLEQIDFNRENLLNNNEMTIEVFNELTAQIKQFGEAVKAKDKKQLEEAKKALKDNLNRYVSYGNLPQDVQDSLQLITAPAFYVGEIFDMQMFNEDMKADLVGVGLCTETSNQSQHDAAWSDTESVLTEAQKINASNIELADKDESSYRYFVNEALQQLANEADRSEKNKYLELTAENSKEVHELAEKLVNEYTTDRQEANNIITDDHDSYLFVETIHALLKSNASKKGLNIEDILGDYTLDELQFYLSEIIIETIASAYSDYKGEFGVGGSTALPAPVRETLTIDRAKAVEMVGEAAVSEAEKRSYDNDAKRQEAQNIADDVKKEAEKNLQDGNYDDFIEDAGKHETDPERKEEMKGNAEEAVENEKELEDLENKGGSGAVTVDPEDKDYVDPSNPGSIEVPKGEVPDGAYTGDYEWSEGETLGDNADTPKVEHVETPTPNTPSNDNPFSGGEVIPVTTSTTSENPFSGGETVYYVDPGVVVDTTSQNDGINMQSLYDEIATIMVEEMATAPVVEETSNLTK